MAKNTPATTGGKVAVNAAVPDFLKDHMNDNRGSEGVRSEDLTIPRLDLCQSLSECRKKNSPDFIEGITEGDLYNSVTRDIYGDTVLVIPVCFKKEYNLWRDQKAGGGFGGSFDSEGDAMNARDQQENPAEWEVVDTAQHFCLLVDEETGALSDIVISMSKSKLRVSRKWNSLIRLNEGPRFSRIYRVNGIADQNNAGQDFFNLAVANVGFVNQEQYLAAERVYELVSSGKATADRSTDASAASESKPTEF